MAAGSRYLLDTHAWVWWLTGADRLTRKQARAMASASAERPLLLSGISLWEVATLVDLGRLELDRPLRTWLEQGSAPPLTRRVSINPAIAEELTRFPTSFHRDPADRIIVATAITLGATLITSDQRIIDAGLVPTL